MSAWMLGGGVTETMGQSYLFGTPIHNPGMGMIGLVGARGNHEDQLYRPC